QAGDGDRTVDGDELPSSAIKADAVPIWVTLRPDRGHRHFDRAGAGAVRVAAPGQCLQQDAHGDAAQADAQIAHASHTASLESPSLHWPARYPASLRCRRDGAVSQP